MKIENAKTTFFADKEQYLNFRKAWADAVNSPEAKSYLVACDEELKPGTERNSTTLYYKTSKGTGRHCVQGWITSTHVMLYNLLREKEAENGFTPITNRTKLENGMIVNDGVYLTNAALRDYCRIASRYADPDARRWYGETLDKFLKSFAGTVTIEMLAALGKQTLEIKPVYPEVFFRS